MVRNQSLCHSGLALCSKAVASLKRNIVVEVVKT